MHAAVIASGVVVNVIIVPDGGNSAAFGAMQCPDNVGVGWRYTGGNFVPPAAPPTPVTVPEQVTAAQALIALSRAGLLDDVQVAVEAAGGEAKIWFERALMWRRDNINVTSIGAALNLDDAAIDDLFVQAAAIVE